MKTEEIKEHKMFVLPGRHFSDMAAFTLAVNIVKFIEDDSIALSREAKIKFIEKSIVTYRVGQLDMESEVVAKAIRDELDMRELMAKSNIGSIVDKLMGNEDESELIKKLMHNVE